MDIDNFIDPSSFESFNKYREMINFDKREEKYYNSLISSSSLNTEYPELRNDFEQSSDFSSVNFTNEELYKIISDPPNCSYEKYLIFRYVDEKDLVKFNPYLKKYVSKLKDYFYYFTHGIPSEIDRCIDFTIMNRAVSFDSLKDEGREILVKYYGDKYKYLTEINRHPIEESIFLFFKNYADEDFLWKMYNNLSLIFPEKIKDKKSDIRLRLMQLFISF